MKTLFTLLTTLLISTVSHSQWTSKTITNGFDDPFKKAYTETNNSGWLAMEAGTPQEVVEYSDTIMKKMILITDKLLISSRISDIPFVESDFRAYPTISSFINKLQDSTVNIKLQYVVSITDIKDKSYTLSYEEKMKLPAYKVVTTGGTYYISETDYYTTGFPKTYELSYMGSGWSEKNLEDIKSLKNYLNNFAIKKTVNYPLLYLHGAYFCDDVINVDFVLVVNGIDKKYELEGMKSSDNKILFFDDNVFSDVNFRTDFLASTKVKIRAKETYCDTEYYTFLMSGSTKAYNFLTK
jgi:hypothetical protein